ncbi:MAG: enoyl-CoA hydratase/isomerase family protein [Actinomycetota bacterium]
MGDQEEILHRVEDGVSWITLNRPDVKNAIAPAHRDRVIELLEEAGADDATRCVVITGSGGSFCSGADLRGSAPTDDSVADVIRKGAQRLIGSVLDCPKPVVAGVDGVAAGIGAHLAFACDLVVATQEARFIEVFVRRALVPDGGGAYLLVRLIGPHKAKELIFFGGDVQAQDAREMGLVNRVVPAEDLDAVLREWAGRLAAGPTRTISLAKKLINGAHDVDRATAFDAEAIAQEENMTTEDAQEGVRSFVERRAPEFKGI